MELYRGKLLCNDKWVIGGVFLFGDDPFVLTTPFLSPDRPAYSRMEMAQGLYENLITDQNEAAQYAWQKALEAYEQKFPNWQPLKRETVTRFTHLHDKNMQPIFEGDVISYEDKLFEVSFGIYSLDVSVSYTYRCLGFFLYNADWKGISTLDVDFVEECEVIGNIFDKPELKQIPKEESNKERNLQ